MNKVVLGVVLGAVLGAFDGMTAWLTPEARAAIVGIVMVGTVKGIIAGVFIGVFARKVHSLFRAFYSVSRWVLFWPSSSPSWSTVITSRSCCQAGWSA